MPFRRRRMRCAWPRARARRPRPPARGRRPVRCALSARRAARRGAPPAPPRRRSPPEPRRSARRARSTRRSPAPRRRAGRRCSASPCRALMPRRASWRAMPLRNRTIAGINAAIKFWRAFRPPDWRSEGAMGFLDQRQWMASLEQQGELRRIKAEVDWDREIGALTRRVLEKKGPALLFENIKGYGDGRCTKLFASGLGARSRLALALGFPRETPNRELVQHVMQKNRETLPHVMVDKGPVKDVILKGDAIDQAEFPVPKWHYLEGGRYIHTFSSIVTRDPDTGVMN